MTKRLGFLSLFRPLQLASVRGLKVDKYTVYAYNMKSQLTCMRGLKDGCVWIERCKTQDK